jgi:hypothetical protein
MAQQLWVNVYDVVQRYGGPEEGGWYYDTGTPEWSETGLCHCPLDKTLHSHYCPIHHLLIEAREWVAGFKPGYIETFINGDPDEPEHQGEAVHRDRFITVETHRGRAYPEHRPHYE